MASFSTTTFSIFFFFLFMLGMVSSKLSPKFYAQSCPPALFVIKKAVDDAVFAERRMGASLLRLHFHDCFVNGCDGSVLLDDTLNFKGEKTARPNNNSLRGFEVIDRIKNELEKRCAGVVSCSDILAVAARDAVVALSGKLAAWKVQLGRRDSTTANQTAANSDLPCFCSNLTTLISAFSHKGFTAQELVALSGAHTIGQARCTVFRDRIYNDTNIDSSFAAELKENCPRAGEDDNLSLLDHESPNIFDNTYFKNLVNKRGLLHSDQELFNGGSTDSIVKTYSFRPATFLADFRDAMIKMGNLSPLTGTNGEIRKNCRKINGS